MSLNHQKITSIETNVINIPLIKPYILSFAKLEHFTSIQVTIEIESGEKNTAEVVPLFGYNDEDEKAILKYLNEIKPVLIGKTLLQARQLIEPEIKNKPFSCSPLLTSIDLFEYKVDNIKTDINIDFVLPTSTKKTNELPDFIKQLKEGTTVKIKLSDNVNNDILFLKKLSNLKFNKASNYRLDANQIYSVKEAELLLTFLNNSILKSKISYIEQPLNVNDWDGTKYLVQKFPDIKIMLDESIITDSDIIKAKEIGVQIIKFKLFKQGGIKELINQTKLAKKLNLKVVLGNGVATWLSNKIEADLFNSSKIKYFGACEANGFLKTK